MRAFYSTIRLIEAAFVVDGKSFLNSGTTFRDFHAERWLRENNLGDGVDPAPYTGDLDDVQCSC